MHVRWTKTAVDDLTHICDYSEDHFGAEQGHRVAVAVYDSTESLRVMPNRGRVGRKPNVSGLPFVIIYRVGRGVVEILRGLHGAQKWP